MKTIRTGLLQVVAVSVALAVIVSSNAETRAQTEAPKHRVLYKNRTTLNDSWNITYWVTVDQYLTVQSLRSLVCAVVEEEKPTDYSRLSIAFNYRLGSFNLVYTDDYNQSRLARYNWSETLGGSPYSLARWRDEHGERLPRGAQFSSFDHTKECPVEEDPSSGSDPGGEK